MQKRVIVIIGLVLCMSVLTFLSGCCINVADVFKAKSKRTEHKSVLPQMELDIPGLSVSE